MPLVRTEPRPGRDWSGRTRSCCPRFCPWPRTWRRTPCGCRLWFYCSPLGFPSLRWLATSCLSPYSAYCTSVWWLLPSPFSLSPCTDWTSRSSPFVVSEVYLAVPRPLTSVGIWPYLQRAQVLFWLPSYYSLFPMMLQKPRFKSVKLQECCNSKH